ncbi:N-acetyltransferase [Klebsiella michiganensis]|uniref:N-acetyltransferase n=1 Tax=Klebsiella michiganensis TaxID=1134687 RepID=A0A7H4LTR5_9ENTR|nr:N-acetyltransferase [Klebsiella michiganensis]
MRKLANQYGFDLSPQEWIDFAPANFLNSTHPDAVFVQKLLVIQHQPEGRFILLGNTLKSITADRVEKQRLEDDGLRMYLSSALRCLPAN